MTNNKSSREGEVNAPSPASGGQVLSELRGRVLFVTLARFEKRNALNDPSVLQLGGIFAAPPEKARVAIIAAEGEHFSAGLDLSELTDRGVEAGVAHSMMWHQMFERIEFGKIPVIAVLKGAVVGGGLELAAAAHIRIAEETTYYGLPEGQRGIFVGGGGAVRIPRLIGLARMQDMMLTGRTYDAAEGAAAGLSQYLVPAGTGMAKAMELAEIIADNAPLTNFAVVHALPRIVESDRQSGLVFESLMAAIAQSDPVAKERIRDFIEKRAPKVRPPR
jgi:enoyl-CoA hydratase/carnithine racemase